MLYSGGRRTAADSLKTAAEHGFTEAYLGCPVLIGDGMDGRDISGDPLRVPAFFDGSGRGDHPESRRIRDLFPLQGAYGIGLRRCNQEYLDGIGLPRPEATDACRRPSRLIAGKCTRCGLCAEVCPTGAAVLPQEGEPKYDLKTCIGCSQCIALCPEMALKIIWDTDVKIFQERLVETAAALWKEIGKKTLIINALLNITAECDCLEGNHPVIATDYGFIGGSHPLTVDEASLRQIGAEPFDRAHPGLPGRGSSPLPTRSTLHPRSPWQILFSIEVVFLDDNPSFFKDLPGVFSLGLALRSKKLFRVPRLPVDDP